jgi:hypothetical protein
MSKTADIFGKSYAVYEPEMDITGKWNLRRVDKTRTDDGVWEIMEVYYDSKDRPVSACAFALSQMESANFTSVIGMLQSAQAKPVLKLAKDGKFIN